MQAHSLEAHPAQAHVPGIGAAREKGSSPLGELDLFGQEGHVLVEEEEEVLIGTHLLHKNQRGEHSLCRQASSGRHSSKSACCASAPTCQWGGRGLLSRDRHRHWRPAACLSGSGGRGVLGI